MDTIPNRRTEVLNTALQLLRERGFGALTQHALADAAGIRQGLLTYYFPRRADLLRAIAEHAAHLALAPPLAADTGSGRPPPPITIEAIRHRLLEDAADEGMPRLMLSLILMADEDSDVRQWVATFQQGLVDQLDQALRAAGHPIPAERMERLHATLIGLRIRGLMHLPGDDPAHLRSMCDDAFCDAVFPSGKPKPSQPVKGKRR